MSSARSSAGAQYDEVTCRDGTVAVGGGLQTEASDSKPNVLASAPFFRASNGLLTRISTKEDGTYGASGGWRGEVWERASNLRPVVVCADAGDVKTVISSATIPADASPVSAEATCPIGYVATGGGAEPASGASMPYLVSSAPQFPSHTQISAKSDGDHPAASGWRVNVRNSEGSGGSVLKVAVICLRLNQVTTVVRSGQVAAGASYATKTVSCPSGSVATAGGVMNIESGTPPSVVGLSPKIGSMETNDFEQLRVYSGPDSWLIEVQNQNGNAGRTFKVAAICVPT